MEVEWLKKKLPRSAEVKRQCVDPDHDLLSVSRQCQLLGLARSSWYYEARGESEENLELMRSIDRLYTKCPFLGTRKIRRLFEINRKRAQRLMGLLGLEAACPKRSTSRPAPGHHPNSTLSKAPICPKNGVHLRLSEPKQLQDRHLLLLRRITASPMKIPDGPQMIHTAGLQCERCGQSIIPRPDHVRLSVAQQTSEATCYSCGKPL